MNDLANHNAAREKQLDAIIAEYACRMDSGEEVDRESLLRQYPELAESLLEHFADLDAVLMWRRGLPDGACMDTDAYRTLETKNPPPASPQLVLSGSAMSPSQRTGKELFGRYRIDAVLGEGAMGAVYKAFDSKLHRDVAIKVPMRDQNSNPELMERFLTEARLAAKLSHRNLCPVYDTGMFDGCHYIAMSLVKGHPLSAYIRRGKALPQRAVAHLVRKLATALSEAHSENVIHRDLKPANIMVDEKQEPVIMDFGLARWLDTNDGRRLTVAGAILGTLSYMAPEQAQGESGPACDIYSLGVILYELLTGQLPLNLSGSLNEIVLQIAAGQPLEPSDLRSDLDPRLREICLKMIAKRVEDRYATMDDVADALTAYLKSTTAKSPRGKQRDAESLAELFANRSEGSSAERDTMADAIHSAPTLVAPADHGPARNRRIVPPTARWTLAAASVGLLAMLGFAFLVVSGKTAVRVEVDEQLLGEEAITLRIAEQELEIKGLGDTIHLRPGIHHFEVRRGDTQIRADEFTVSRSGANVLRISVVEEAPKHAADTAAVAQAALNPSGRSGSDSSPLSWKDLTQYEMGSVKLAAGVFRNEFPDWPDRLRSIFIPVANKHIETGKWIYVSAKANQAGGPGAAFTVLEYQFEQPVFGFRATISPLNEKTEATTEFRIRVDGKILAQYVVNNRGKSFELKSDVPFETLSLESRKLSKRGGNLAIYADPAILVRSGQP